MIEDKITLAQEILASKNIGLVRRYNRPRWVTRDTRDELSTEEVIAALVAGGIDLNEVPLVQIQRATPSLPSSNPRNADTPPLDEEAAIKDAMEQANVSFRIIGGIGEFFQKEAVLSLDTVVSLLAIETRKMGLKMSPVSILQHLDVMVDKVRVDQINQLSDHIRFDPALAGQWHEKFETLTKLISGPKYHHLYPIILYHALWLVKCRHNRRTPSEIKYPIFLSFYSKEGQTGKSTFLNKLFGVIPGRLVFFEPHMDSLINDSRKAHSFMDYLVIVAGELGGLGRSDVMKFKGIIDLEFISMRLLGYNKDRIAYNQATIFGTSNKPLKELLRDGPTPRKWCEIPFHHYGADHHNISWLPIQNFDYLSLWRSVDENSPSPLEAHYTEFKKFVADTCGVPFNDYIYSFVKQYILDLPPNHVGATIGEIYDQFKQRNPRCGSTASHLEEFLLYDANFKVRTSPQGRLFLAPPVDRSPLFSFWEIDQYLEGKDKDQENIKAERKEVSDLKRQIEALEMQLGSHRDTILKLAGKKE